MANAEPGRARPLDTQLDVRAAREADLPTLHALIESAYRGANAREGWTHEADLVDEPRTSIAELAGFLRNPDRQLLVIGLISGEIVASVHLERRSPALVHLGLFAVSPSRQGAGLGKQLLAAAERIARDSLGAQMMELTVITKRTELIAFYARRGYALSGEIRTFPIPLDPELALAVLAKPIA